MGTAVGPVAEVTAAADDEQIQELQREIIKRDNEIEQLADMVEGFKRKTTSVGLEREDEVKFLHEELKKKDSAIEMSDTTKLELERDITQIKEDFEEEREHFNEQETENIHGGR